VVGSRFEVKTPGEIGAFCSRYHRRVADSSILSGLASRAIASRSVLMSTKKDLTRREFVAGAGKATLGAMVVAGAPLILPSRVLGRGRRAPSDTANIAVVGFGSMGSQNALRVAQTDHIGAVCDVDFA
jgi:hypothetical protein